MCPGSQSWRRTYLTPRSRLNRAGAGRRPVEPRLLGPDLIENRQEQICSVRWLLRKQRGIGLQVGTALNPERELQVEGSQK